MIKLAIDISLLKTTHAARGIGAYTQRLVEALENVKISGDRNFRVDAFDFKTQSLKFKTQKYDLIHYPYFDLFFLSLPLRKMAKTVVTIHDVIPLIFPKHYPSGLKGKIKFLVQKFSLKGVEAVITDSENSKRDIVRYLGFPEDKIYVVYLAPGEKFRKMEDARLPVPPDRGEPARQGKWKMEVRKKYNLSEKFVLYVGDVNYNKNIVGLIKAFERLGDLDVDLVLAGKAFQNNDLKETKEIIQLIKELKLEKKVIRLGWVSEEDLVKIYNLATAYCQPSFYEGFGLPVLEAMACGCPVVAAKTSSLPEICGEAALFFDPKDYNDMAEKIRGVVKNLLFKENFSRKGLAHVKKFSWEKAALETIKVYHEVAS